MGLGKSRFVMRYRHVILSSLSALALAVGVLIPAAPSASAATYNINRGPNYTSRVVLTFDDCPRTLSAYVNVMAWAKRTNTGLVVAPTGDCQRKFRTLNGVNLATIARQNGQYAINHSISHPDLRTLSCAGVARQLGAPGVVTNYGRPPYGAMNAAVSCGYRLAGMRPWLWNVDTQDWTGKTRAQVVSHTVRFATRGSTVLMHMQWNGFNPTAIAQMKSGLAARGLQVCRAYRGTDNVGPVVTSPTYLPARLQC